MTKRSKSPYKNFKGKFMEKRRNATNNETKPKNSNKKPNKRIKKVVQSVKHQLQSSKQIISKTSFSRKQKKVIKMKKIQTLTDQESSRKKFTLLKDTPWHSCSDQSSSSDEHDSLPSTTFSYQIHNIPPDVLTRFDSEIRSFCDYVRLHHIEKQARENIISTVRNLAGDRWRASEIVPFGSYTSLEVCTFFSDVDMALWGVVSPNGENNKRKREMQAIGQNRKRRRAEIEEEEKKMENLIVIDDDDDDDGEGASFDHPITIQGEEDDNNKEEDDNNKEEDDKNLKEENVKEEADKKENDNNLKEGNYSNDKEENANNSEEENDEDKPKISNFAGSANDPLVIEDDDDSRSITKPTSDFSSADDADKMESFHSRKPSSNIPSHILQNLQNAWPSSDDDSDDDHSVFSYDDDDLREARFQVSYFASSTPTTRPQMGISNTKTRRLVVTALQALGKKLRRCDFSNNVEVRKNARVPIIKMQTVLGVEGDIALGGHNGMDTSLYARKQIDRHKSFAEVVILLKILLQQNELDKPFTGGLGSYKLYVLVAYHIEKHLSLGGIDRPSEILLSFLFRFSISDPSRYTTQLSQYASITSDGHTADLQPVFRIDECVYIFKKAYERLTSHCTCEKEGVSILEGIINVKSLKREREISLSKARLVGSFKSGTLKRSELKRGPRGGIIPNYRPDVEAKKGGNELVMRGAKNKKNQKNKEKKRKERMKKFAVKFMGNDDSS